jgi:hypothetical protein
VKSVKKALGIMAVLGVLAMAVACGSGPTAVKDVHYSPVTYMQTYSHQLLK